MHFACVLDPDLLVHKTVCPQKFGKSLLLYFPIFDNSAFSHVLNKLPEGLHESRMIYALLDFSDVAHKLRFCVRTVYDNFQITKILHTVKVSMKLVGIWRGCTADLDALE